MELRHYAMCYETPYGRAGVVETWPKLRQEYQCFPANTKRIGYVGCNDFSEAVKRAGMMERNELNAWGSF